MAFSRYPEVVLAGARERRERAQRRLANGSDPMADRMAQMTRITVPTPAETPTHATTVTENLCHVPWPAGIGNLSCYYQVPSSAKSLSSVSIVA